jgi:hypothetical protein
VRGTSRASVGADNLNVRPEMKPSPIQYDNYPWTTPLLENAVWLVVYALGFVIVSLLSAWAALAYLGYSLVCMYLVIPRFICTHCTYYGKTCHSGQGRLAALLFPRQETGRFGDYFKYMRFAAPVFLAPIFCGLALFIIHFSWERVGLTIAFGILALGCTRIVTLNLGCPHCEQRSVCPAWRNSRE